MFHCRVASAPLLAVLLAGCGSKPAAPADRVPPNPNAPARYGPPTGVASKEIPRALPNSRDTNWQSAPFYILCTELSPGVLVHSSTRYLGLFAGLPAQQLGAPSHGAWSTKDGPRPFSPGETLDASAIEENWLLVWFAGATNWANWDSPWAVFLQHKPKWLRLDERGLHLEFPSHAGDVVLMPLYGYFKLPPAGHDYLAEHGLKSRRLNSWEWERALARDPLTRLRYWAGASREFPIYCEDSFSVDRARDELTLRSRFEWHSIHDDWNTRHVKLAPVSPALGLAAKDKAFPAKFSKAHFDMELPTPFGPLLGIPDTDAYDVTLPVLHYVNEVEAIQAPDPTMHPTVAQALERLNAFLRTNPPPARRDLEPPDNRFLLAGLLARALPVAEPSTRDKLALHLKSLLLELAAAHSQPGQATDIAAGTFEAVWAYGHSSGDWETVRKLWAGWRPRIAALNQGRWATCGPESELVGDAQECAALARIAYRMGDQDLYHYASLQFVHELVRASGFVRASDFVQKQYPWHSMDWAEHPGTSRNKPFELGLSTWLLTVNDPGLARFYRDYLRDEMRLDLDWLQGARAGHGDAKSLVAPRGWLLNETPAQLAAIATPGQFSEWDGVSAWLAVLRASRPVQFERLIPPGERSPFVAGLERETNRATPSLVTGVESSDGVWPKLIWPRWKAPDGSAWSFGRIQPVRDGTPVAVKRTALNWNTEVLTYTLP